jgi:peroxidase
VIDEAKAALEEACPRTVSCSDILAFAARDASYILSKYMIYYTVPAGRCDGSESFANETMGQNLPPPFAGVAQLIDMFKIKGLDENDMVVLSGAHTIGRSGCLSFSDRVNPPNSPSPSMHPALAADMNKTCDTPNRATTNVPQDSVTPDVLDNQYYKNVLSGKVLFTSDAALNSSSLTRQLVEKYARDYIYGQGEWNTAFAKAMVKMGNIEVKTKGQIRLKCGRVN